MRKSYIKESHPRSCLDYFYNSERFHQSLELKIPRRAIRSGQDDEKKKVTKRKRGGNVVNSEGSLPHSHTLIIIIALEVGLKTKSCQLILAGLISMEKEMACTNFAPFSCN